jgi:hypothetical protein
MLAFDPSGRVYQFSSSSEKKCKCCVAMQKAGRPWNWPWYGVEELSEVELERKRSGDKEPVYKWCAFCGSEADTVYRNAVHCGEFFNFCRTGVCYEKYREFFESGCCNMKFGIPFLQHKLEEKKLRPLPKKPATSGVLTCDFCGSKSESVVTNRFLLPLKRWKHANFCLNYRCCSSYRNFVLAVQRGRVPFAFSRRGIAKTCFQRKFDFVEIFSSPSDKTLKFSWCAFCGKTAGEKVSREEPNGKIFSFCPGDECYMKYEAFFESGFTDMTYGVPVFLTAYEHNITLRKVLQRKKKKKDYAHLTCAFCGIKNGRVILNRYLSQKTFPHATFCKNDKCCYFYRQFMKESEHEIPHMYRRRRLL